MDSTAVVLIDGWMRHTEYGIAALLPLVPRQKFGGGDYDEPPIPEIKNDFEHADVAEEINPDGKCSLVIFADAGPEIEMDSGSNTRQVGTNIRVVIVYVTRDVPVLEARRNSSYTLRAVQRSLTYFNSLRKSKEYRTLNGYTIAQIASTRRAQLHRAVGDATFWGFVVAEIEMLDPQP